MDENKVSTQVFMFCAIMATTALFMIFISVYDIKKSLRIISSPPIEQKG